MLSQINPRRNGIMVLSGTIKYMVIYFVIVEQHDYQGYPNPPFQALVLKAILDYCLVKMMHFTSTLMNTDSSISWKMSSVEAE